jgi:hypothetical protein
MKDKLQFVNYTMSLGRALEKINRKVRDSQQHEDLTEDELSLLEVIHNKLFLPGVVTFGDKNIDAAELKVHQ